MSNVSACETGDESALVRRPTKFLGVPGDHNGAERRELEAVEPKLDRDLLRRVDELELSVRSLNCLKNHDIVFVGDLIQKREAEMLRMQISGANP